MSGTEEAAGRAEQHKNTLPTLSPGWQQALSAASTSGHVHIITRLKSLRQKNFVSKHLPSVITMDISRNFSSNKNLILIEMNDSTMHLLATVYAHSNTFAHFTRCTTSKRPNGGVEVGGGAVQRRALLPLNTFASFIISVCAGRRRFLAFFFPKR